MIQFFKHIRQSSIMKNHTAKYLKYAIGEIVLVMIGILLALQVNQWNEERKLLNEEQYLLKELNTEFTTNLELIKRDFNGNKRTSDAIIQVMHLFEEPTIASQAALDSLIVTVFLNTSYSPTTGVVNEIISSGRLGVLRDDSLRYLISQWPSVLENQQEDIDIRWTHFENFVLPNLAKNYPMKNINNHFKFDFWTDSYKRIKLPKSNFDFKPENFFTGEMEGYLYIHSLNQDFVLMNDVETEKYIQKILKTISKNLN